jgi:hypothetical protein
MNTLGIGNLVTPFRRRKIDVLKPVKVYRNLHGDADWPVISYNPYENDYFMCDNLVQCPFPVVGAACVMINVRGVTAAYLETPF